jgi:hypothetical protein
MKAGIRESAFRMASNALVPSRVLSLRIPIPESRIPAFPP